MKFEETSIKGVFNIELDKLTDERGFFARAWCKYEFVERNLNSNLVQCNLSYNKKKGTLRGLHYQVPPYEEVKLVRCIKGAIYDVVVDLRSQSETYRQWMGIKLTEDNYKMLYIPESFGHGFLTLTDDTVLFYQVSEFHVPGAERGLRWNDPTFNIQWPLPVTVISEKDQNYADFKED